MAVGRKGDEQSNHSSTTGRVSIPKPYIAGAKKGSWWAIQFGPRTFLVLVDAINNFLLIAGYDKVLASPKSIGRE